MLGTIGRAQTVNSGTALQIFDAADESVLAEQTWFFSPEFGANERRDTSNRTCWNNSGHSHFTFA